MSNLSEQSTGMPLRSRLFRSACSRLAGYSLQCKRLYISSRLEALGLDHVSAVFTHVSEAELFALYRLASDLPQGARALEIGSYLGASACYLAAALSEIDGTLICVDTWQNETMSEGPRDTFGEFQRNTAPLRDRITPLRKRSDEVVASDVPGELDLVFIDGDHSYDAVRSDFQIFSRLLTSGGILAFHDSLCFPGVSRVIGEALASGEWGIGGQEENLFWITRATRFIAADDGTIPAAQTENLALSKG